MSSRMRARMIALALALAAFGPAFAQGWKW